MFRKLSNQISSAWGGNSSSSNNSDKVRQLVALGFSETSARQALAAASDNVEQAAELLLVQQQMTTGGAPTPPQAATVYHNNRNNNNNHHHAVAGLTEEEQIRRALEASLQVPPPTTTRPTQRSNNTAKPPPRSAATHKAGQAALQRAHTKSPPSSGNSSLSEHHPTVKVIPKLSEKPTEEQILRTTDRLKSHYAAVDTLLKALTAVQQYPENPKYRTIDTTTAGYQRSVAPAPGAADFLRAMQYRPVGNGNKLVLDAYHIDPALLFLGISALQQTKATPEYRRAKGQAVLVQQLQAMRVAADTSEEQAIARAAHLSQCPAEPPVGRGTNLQVSLGSSGGGGTDHRNNDNVLRRRFEGDDTLGDVLHWLAAHYGSTLYDRLMDGTYVLWDVHRNVAVRDAARRVQDTLQYLECWPSGRLQVTTPELLELQGVPLSS